LTDSRSGHTLHGGLPHAEASTEPVMPPGTLVTCSRPSCDAMTFPWLGICGECTAPAYVREPDFEVRAVDLQVPSPEEVARQIAVGAKMAILYGHLPSPPPKPESSTVDGPPADTASKDLENIRIGHCEPSPIDAPASENDAPTADPMRGWLSRCGGLYGIPPASWDYPRGTVWECHCGKTWVSLGAPFVNMPGDCHFKPESQFARWRRTRRERRRA
jgi:hypothetical protein